MSDKLNKVGLSVFKVVLTSILCLTGLLSTVYVALTSNELFSYFYCLATAAFVMLPLAITVFFRLRMNTLFYIIFSFYTLGPLLGAVYNFYYHISWWDVLLHILAGTIFAAVGAQLAYVINKNGKTSYVFAAVFGVLVSVCIAVLWEFFEYGCDVFLNSDMQADTVISLINTKIKLTDGITDVFENITETLVNGRSLGINGYLDIGLIDTMQDMMVETVGALLLMVYVAIDRNRHPMIVGVPKK